MTPEASDIARNLRDVEGVDLRDRLEGVGLLVHHQRHVVERASYVRLRLASRGRRDERKTTKRTGGGGIRSRR